MLKVILVVAGISMLLVGGAKAEEQTRMLAQGGAWMAMQHSPSMTAPADVCVLGNVASHVYFRQDGDGLEVRVTDDDWSLPADVKGTIGLAVGPVSKAFPISTNTDTSVSASVSEDDVQPLFTAMAKAVQMTVTIGKAKTRIASLTGSMRAVSAFKTCAGIKAAGQTSPSANPFQ